MKRIGVLIALLALTVPASASGVTLVRPDGSRPEPLATWVKHARVPSPEMALTVFYDASSVCDGSLACASDGLISLGGPRCSLPRRYRTTCQFIAFHEIGHNDDHYRLTDAQRAQFMALPGVANSWYGDIDGDLLGDTPHEMYADAWAMCAIGQRMSDVDISHTEAISLHFQPSAKTYRRACNIIRA